MLRGLKTTEPQGVGDQFALLVTNVVDYAIFMLDPTGHIVTWNEGAQRIKGYSADDIIGRHFSTFYLPEEARSGKPEWELEVARREGRYEEEGWRVRRDGSRFWASVVITALRDPMGRLRGFGKVTRDLTERHARELEREAAVEREARQLRAHADRMARLERTKTEFLNLASHELRGPLTVVRGYNSMFEDGSISGDRVPPVARLIEAKLAQIDLLVEQMLETARLEYGDVVLQRTTFDLGKLVCDQLDTFRPLARGHELTAEVQAEPVIIDGDRSRIGTVVANLIDNALKYSPDGGEIRCTLTRRDDEVVLQVSDHGIGIAEEHMSRLFMRFGRLPTEENISIAGTGLGLFLCREIANRHGGALIAESELGRGSTFTLTLPDRSVEEPARV